MTVTKESKKGSGRDGRESSLVQKLVAFGLSHAEASVYIYLLQKGKETGGSKIALGTGLHRQYVYLALPKLVAEGLVSEVPHGKQSKYKARAPHVIESLGRKKALEAGDLARELALVSAIGNEQDFEVLQGKRAIQEYEIQNASSSGKEECIIGGASSAFADLMDDALDEYLNAKKKNKTHVKYLGTEDERLFYEQYTDKFDNQEYRFLHGLPKGKTHMVIRTDSVSFFTFLHPPLVYVVKSTVVADNYRQFFMMLWDVAKTEAKTYEGAIENMREALTLHTEGLQAMK